MFYSITVSFLIALSLALLLSLAFKRPGPGPMGGLLFIFLVIFLSSWAIGGWIEPVNPYQVRYPWVNYVLLALFFMLLLGVLLPAPQMPRDRLTKPDNSALPPEREAAGITLGIFFWIMMFLLIAVGLARWF